MVCILVLIRIWDGSVSTQGFDSMLTYNQAILNHTDDHLNYHQNRLAPLQMVILSQNIDTILNSTKLADWVLKIYQKTCSQ